MKEEFRDIPDFEGYQVSNLGRIKSLPREICNNLGCYTSKESILKLNINSGGYYQISITIKNKKHTKTVHTLMSRAFLNYSPDGTHNLVIDHVNNIKTDNRLENLQLISHRLNSSKDRKNGTSKYTGVFWDKQKKKWVSKIYINYKSIYLGCFNSDEEASKAYQNKLKEINGIRE